MYRVNRKQWHALLGGDFQRVEGFSKDILVPTGERIGGGSQFQRGVFAQTDVAFIIGANDVVNPAAKTDKTSPIYGMPVIKVWAAKSVIVMKRSMRPGYAGIENPLFFHAKTKMLFGDAKDTLQKLVAELKNV